MLARRVLQAWDAGQLQRESQLTIMAGKWLKEKGRRKKENGKW